MICTIRKTVDRQHTYDALWFWCPGCKCAHAVPVFKDGVQHPVVGPAWNWNGSTEKPTLSPSLLTHGSVRCHCFIREGNIEFLHDCEHELAGKTVSIPELPDWLQ